MRNDFDQILIDRDRIAARVREIGRDLAADLIRALRAEGHDPDQAGHVVLVPVMTGALVFVADLIRELPMKLSLGVVAVTSYPGTATKTQGAKLASELPDNLTGRHVVVVDDILDSGETAALVKRLIEQKGAASVRVCVLLRKNVEGRPPVIEADYAGFEIPDEFVVGYGLDYNGLYRNHPEIVTLKPEAIADQIG
ncbi:MAG: phosphoribosyltransferase family protein [Planctomycetota bacterium]